MSDDLISREKTVNVLRGEALEKYSHSFLYGLFAAANEVLDIPAVDAVAVVRCRECKFLGFKDFDGICNGPKVLGIVQPDSYCSWGERKDNETDRH